LEYLNQKKKSGYCNKVYIYTNNQCPDDWANLISDYFNRKLLTNNNIFDKVICAFKINNRQIEFSRTTHEKTHNDFKEFLEWMVEKSPYICIFQIYWSY
jgi:hypothetical protein